MRFSWKLFKTNFRFFEWVLTFFFTFLCPSSKLVILQKTVSNLFQWLRRFFVKCKKKMMKWGWVCIGAELFEAHPAGTVSTQSNFWPNCCYNSKICFHSLNRPFGSYCCCCCRWSDILYCCCCCWKRSNILFVAVAALVGG